MKPVWNFLRDCRWLLLIPRPFLTRLLVLVGRQDRERLLQAVSHLTSHTFQRRAALAALLELVRLDLLECRTLNQIADMQSQLGWLPVQQVSGTATDALQRCQQISSEVAASLASTSNYQKLTALNRARRQLDELRQFAVVSLSRREAPAFSQIAQQWLETLNAEIDRLTIEEQAEERIPNPYIAPRPLIPGNNVFVGRTDVFRFIEEHFLYADQNIPIILHGQPRIGKSSVLRHLASQLPTNLIPVYIDMQRMAQVESTGGLLFNLTDAIGSELGRRGVRLNVPTLSDYAVEPFIVCGKFLDDVEEAIHAPDQRLIVALDEFEEIERKLTEGTISQDLMPFLRNMMQHRQGLALLFAGTHTLEEMIEGYWIPYFRSAVPLRVSYLDESDARRLITNPLDAFPLDYEPEAVELLLHTTHAHPCLLQLACSALVDHKNSQHSHLATVADVEVAIAKVLETGDYVFRGIWDWVPEREKELLSELASVEQAGVADFKRALQLPEEQVQHMLARLVEVEAIKVAPSNNGDQLYHFQVELFRQWVARHAARVSIRAAL